MVRNKLYISKDFNIQPSEIDRMVYYEYEQLLDDIKEMRDKEEEERKKQEKQQNSSSPYKMPKAPSLPKVSIPRF